MVVGKVTYIIQEPSCKKLKTPSARTKWKPPSEVYINANGEEVSIMLDGLEWDILDHADWEGIELDTPPCSDSDEDKAEDEGDEGGDEENHHMSTPGNDESFIVAQVLKRRHGRNGVDYYVQWEGYGAEDNNWERAEHLNNQGGQAGAPAQEGGEPPHAQPMHHMHGHAQTRGGRNSSGRSSRSGDGGGGAERAEIGATQAHREDNEEACGDGDSGSQEGAVPEGCDREGGGQGASHDGGRREDGSPKDDEGRHRNAPRVCTRGRIRTARGSRADEDEGDRMAAQQPGGGPERAPEVGGCEGGGNERHPQDASRRGEADGSLGSEPHGPPPQ